VHARRVIALALAVSGLLVVVPAASSAHALLISSTPTPGVGLSVPPPAITATFSEPLNRPLSTLKLTTSRGVVVPATVVSDGSVRLVLRPLRRLRRGVYDLAWHTVSADDGHTTQGSYSFGVLAAVPGPAVSAPAGPLAGGGWLRALLDAAFDGTLILFCGGVFCAALLSPRGEPAGWLLPGEGRDRDVARRQWRLTVAIGGAAVVFSVLATLADGAHAGGGLGFDALRAYLLSDLAGYARLAVPVVLLVSVALAARGAPRAAGVTAVLALAAVAGGGHAISAHLPVVAFMSDLLHLIAGSVWLGGIVQIVIAWVPRLRRMDVAGRRRIVEVVLPRFGAVALPAFVTLVAAGAINAATEIGSPHALWSDAYGRVLLAKTALVCVVAVLSYRHAIRLRPRLLASGRAYDIALERRHWRLLASEPILGTGIFMAAALLVAYAPPIDLAEQIVAARPVAPATVREASAAGSQLSVAGEAGPYIVNALVSPRAGGVSVEVNTLTAFQKPVALRVRVAGVARGGACGVGCTRVALAGAPASLAVSVTDGGRVYHVSLPIRYQPGTGRLAGQILTRVERADRRLRSVAIHETLGSGTGAPEVTSYQVGMPDRFAYQLSHDGRLVSDTKIVGTHEWTRAAGARRWDAGVYGGGGPPFSAAGYLGWWTPFVGQSQLLDRTRTHSGERADIATVARIAGLGTVWLRFAVDVTHDRIIGIDMITTAHFMTQRWGSFNGVAPISPPASGSVAGG
jgi:copper transport protein